jgi:acyl transferase domain-containing protein/acyl carrier protein
VGKAGRKEMEKIMNISELENDTRIAIIGMAGRFPGANNVDQFWENLKNGFDSLQHFTDEELEECVASEILNDPNFVKAGHILEDVDQFDAGFFNFTPRQAELIDPQQRLFLECAWEALEHAGYVPEKIQGAVGVYASAAFNSYIFNLASGLSLLDPVKFFNILMSNDKDYLASRVSYKLNLKGPSVVVQSACSSSLVGACLACQGLLTYQCDMALVGGVAVGVPQKVGYLYEEGNEGISRDARCRAFDAKASGMAYGNGVGIIVLKRLFEALKDGDTVYAAFRGFAINNDGSNKVGFSALSVDGEVEVISEAMAMAEVEPESISYVEAHGTATPMGDPIEITALSKAFGVEKRGYCAVGSVKTNIGHLNTAAGVASLIKTALALKHKILPPSLHFEEPNPEIDFEHSPFYVNSELKPWEGDGVPLRAGVSSFGLGGTNAHMILEEAPVVDSPEYHRPWHLLVLSARTEAALNKATERLISYLKKNPDINLSNVAYTLQVGRKAFAHRKTLVCRDRDEAISSLENDASDRVLISIENSQFETKSVVFMFPGAGPQYVNMGFDLYENESVFRETVDQCAEYLKPVLKLDLRDVLYPKANRLDESTKMLNEPFAGLPALFVADYALARLWQSWGIEPASMIGHSLGEYVAATLAGVFSLEDALYLVARRGQLMEEVLKGGMMVVLAPENEVKALLGEQLSIGAVNGPSLCTVSGSAEDIDELQKSLKEKKLVHRRLSAGRAGHSSMMDPIIDRFRDFVSAVKLNVPKIPFLSNTSGTWITDEEATNPNYWASHLRKTVRFSDGIEELLKNSENILLEVGPGRGLNTLVKRHPMSTTDHSILSSIPDEQQAYPDTAFITRALGSLWLSGLKIDWSKAIYSKEYCGRIPLPTYPFERQRHWIEPTNQGLTVRGLPATLDKRPDIADWFYVPSWKRSLPLRIWSAAELVEEKRTWMVFVDTCEVGSAMVEHLSRERQEVILVRMGDDFARLRDGEYCINPGQQKNYDALLQELVAAARVPGVIAHLWNVTPNDQLGRGLQFYDEVQDRGYNSLIYLMRAFLASNLNHHPLQLGVVSTNLHSVTGSEQLSPEKSTLLGPCKVIPKEFPNVHCINVDVQLDEGNDGMSSLADRLIAEFALEPDSVPVDTVIAYRGKHRWVQNFEPVCLKTPEAGKHPLRQGGVYLITGGMGGIGFILAEHLAQACQAKLVLIGRSELPERDKWKQWLDAHDEQNELSQRIHKIIGLERIGAEVLVVNADVGDMDQMHAAYTQATERFGPLNGVIHAAGIATGGLIELQTPIGSESNVGPKVRGTLILDELCRETHLDFFMLCSSLIASVGTVGGVDYTSANIFMDTFANYSSMVSGRHTVAVNWDYWLNIGMTRDFAAQHKAITGEEEMVHAIKPAEGIEVFNRVLSTHLPQVLVSTRDFLLLLQDIRQMTKSMREVFEEANLEKSSHPRPNLGISYVAPRNELEQTVADVWQEVIGIDALGINDPYLEIGGDSFHAMPLVARLRNIFHTELPLRSIFSHDTVTKQAQFIVENEDQEGKSEKIARAFQQVKSMSEEEVKLRLQSKQAKQETKSDG